MSLREEEDRDIYALMTCPKLHKKQVPLPLTKLTPKLEISFKKTVMMVGTSKVLRANKTPLLVPLTYTHAARPGVTVPLSNKMAGSDTPPPPPPPPGRTGELCMHVFSMYVCMYVCMYVGSAATGGFLRVYFFV
jgi:hypothetical protein